MMFWKTRWSSLRREGIESCLMCYQALLDRCGISLEDCTARGLAMIPTKLHPEQQLEQSFSVQPYDRPPDTSRSVAQDCPLSQL